MSKAKDGQAALDSLRRETPDLMLLNIQMMPDMDGVEVVTAMKERVPFLIQSTLPDSDPRVVRLMELSGRGRVSPKTLLQDVERALDAG